MNNILDYLNYLFPNPKCELNYNKDYQLLLAVMMSAQTTDKRVNQVTSKLFDKYNSLEKLANANQKEIEKIIKSIGNYSKKSNGIIEISKILLNKYQGVVPSKRSSLEAMPMVGRKTTNVVLSELYHIPTIAVDTHVFRVSKRLGLAKNTDNVLQVEQKLKKKIPRSRWSKAHLQLVLFGRYYCMARSPRCEECKLQDMCKYKKKKN